jgi:hypothetical protein
MHAQLQIQMQSLQTVLIREVVAVTFSSGGWYRSAFEGSSVFLSALVSFRVLQASAAGKGRVFHHGYLLGLLG